MELDDLHIIPSLSAVQIYEFHIFELVPVLQRSWVRFPFKPEFFQVSSFQPLRLKHFHCDDLHIIPRQFKL